MKQKINKIYCLAGAALACLAMNCKLECIEGGRDSSLINGMYKLYHSFYSYNFMDMFIFFSIFIIIMHVRNGGGGM